ncbi:MAG TPA: hypothetical protein VHX88_18575 [Solirubrobacteraceae bacterium]|jgi:MFS family permease|nr:hypothetical protein [Solirubrobacteraceae bacterium]
MPAVGALATPIAGRLADHRDSRLIAVPGALSFAAGAALLYARAGHHPAYLATWLPCTILLGAGTGFGYTALVSIAALDLTPPTFGVGSATNAMTRQLAAVLGVAILVAVVGTPSPAHAVDALNRAWIVAGLASLAAAVSCAWLRPLTRARATAPGRLLAEHASQR